MAVIHETWPRKPLGEVADVVSGYAFKSSEFGERGIPVIKIKNVRVGHVDLSEVERVDEKYLSIPERYHVRGGDVLISLTGSHISQPNSVVGRVARHSPDHPECLLNQRAGKVILKDSCKSDLGFLFYALSEQETVRAIAMKAHGAANQANVSPTQVESVEIPLPPLPVQRRIAGVLSAYDDLIENNQRRIKILEEMARSLYREWFVHLRFPGHDKVKMVPSLLGPIPRGWEAAPLSSVVDFAKGRKPSETRKEGLPGDVPLLLIDTLRGGEAEFASPEKLVTAETRDTIMVMDGASSCEVAIGYSGAVGSTLGRFRSTNTKVFSPHTLYSFLETKAEEFKSKNIGAAIPHANKDYILTQHVPLPPEAIASQFHGHLEPLQGTIEILKAQVQNLRRTRDLLLPRLLSGQLLQAVS